MDGQSDGLKAEFLEHLEDEYEDKYDHFMEYGYKLFVALATLVFRYLKTDTFSRKEMLSIMRFFVVGHDKEKRDCGF